MSAKQSTSATPGRGELGRAGWELIAAAQAGNRDAFAQLYRHYRPQVARFIASKVRDRAAVEDLTADTFLKAWRGIDRVSDQGRDVASWLISIAHRRVIDHARSAGRARVVLPAQPIGPQDTGVVDPAPGPDSVVPEQRNREAARVELGRYLAQLSERERRCLHLRYAAELGPAQLGAHLGCTPGAAKSLRDRAVRRLAGLLAADGHTSATAFATTVPDLPAIAPAARGAGGAR